MPNPNPVQSDLFKQKRFNSIDTVDQPLAKKAIGVKLPIDQHEVLERMTPQDKAALLREIIKEGLEKRNLI
jgi:hypothetical protein